MGEQIIKCGSIKRIIKSPNNVLNGQYQCECLAKARAKKSKMPFVN